MSATMHLYCNLLTWVLAFADHETKWSGERRAETKIREWSKRKKFMAWPILKCFLRPCSRSKLTLQITHEGWKFGNFFLMHK